MQGDLVSLCPVEGDEDYELLARWSASTSGVYSNGRQTFMTGAQMKDLMSQGGVRFLMVKTRDGEKVGGVSWQEMAYPGSFSVGNAVGDPQLWGLGYGVESVMLLLEHLFHAQNAHRVHLMTALFNKQMVQIFLRGPIRLEGVLRDYFFLDGAYHDALVGSLLRDEYYAALDTGDLARMNLVPDADKEEAARLLRDHLDRNPISHR